MTKNENSANVLECKPIEMFKFMLKAKVYMDNWGAQNLKQLEIKIRTCVKKSYPDLLVIVFGRDGSSEAK